MLYMFRTILVHHQEQLYKLYIAFGICRYMPVRVAVVWIKPHNSHTYGPGIYQMRCTAYKVAPSFICRYDPSWLEKKNPPTWVRASNSHSSVWNLLLSPCIQGEFVWGDCLSTLCFIKIYVVGSKSFRPDQLFKVTEIKQLCYFST